MGPECGKKLVCALEVRREIKAFTQGFTGPWLINGDTWTVNPLTVIPRAIFDVVDMWMAMRLREKDGGHFLPSAGGMMDQPAALIEAFGILDAAMGPKAADIVDEG